MPLRKRGGNYELSVNINGRRLRRSLQTGNLEIAKERAEALTRSHEIAVMGHPMASDPPDPKRWAEEILTQPDNKTSWLYRIYLNSRHGSARRRISFALSYDELKQIAVACGGRCAVTHVPLTINLSTGHRASPFTPSLDRRDSKLGYTPKNCRLVAYITNLAMSTWGEGPLKVMLAHYFQQGQSPYSAAYEKLNNSYLAAKR